MRVFAYLGIKQGGHEEKFFMLLCKGGMSLNGSTSSTQTPVNIKSSACCNKESKRAVRRIVLERSTGKHRSLPSATGRFVLMMFSKDRFFFSFFFFCLRSSCIYLFASISWRITLTRECRNTFTIESTCQPQLMFVEDKHKLPSLQKPGKIHFFIFLRWGSGVHLEVLTSPKCQSVKG